MKRQIITAALAMIAICGYAQQTKEVTGFNTPESVVAKCKNLYVSNMGSKVDPIAKDGDGFISKLDRKDGKIIEQKWITGLNSPKGLKIVHGKLYVADVDRLMVYCVKTGKKLWEQDFDKIGVNYLNDVSIRGCGSVFVSATDKDAIYKVCKKKIIQVKVKGTIEGANGLYRSLFKLYIANYGHAKQPNGSFGVINLITHKYHTYESGGMYDGIQKYRGKILVSDWINSSGQRQGKLFSYQKCHKKYTEIAPGVDISGPSDIYLDRKMKVLWIPCMLDNKIVSVPFSALKTK
jgi:hypothetical protein